MKKTLFLVTYALAACLIFSVASQRENQTLKYLLHGEYTNKMADASTQLNQLQQAVQQSLLYKDPTALNNSLQDVWRLSSDMRYSIAGLPLDRDFTNVWMNYLGRLGNNAKMTMTSQEGVTNWHDNVKQVANNLHNFSTDWQIATSRLLQNDENYKQWLEEQTTNADTSGFKNLTNSVKTYTESDFPLTASEADHEKKKELKEINDKQITKEEAIERFNVMFPELENATLSVNQSKNGAPYPFYHIVFHKGERTGYADITLKGGHLLSYLVERPFENKAMSVDQIKHSADLRLKELGYKDVKETNAIENNDVWHITYARIDEKTKAKVYADSVQVKIAKDTGEVVGLNGVEYIQKEVLKPQIMKKINWDEFFNNDAKIVAEDLAYSENKDFVERLCYELTVLVNSSSVPQTYKILVDTETGEVIKNEKLST